MLDFNPVDCLLLLNAGFPFSAYLDRVYESGTFSFRLSEIYDTEKRKYSVQHAPHTEPPSYVSVYG